METLYKELYDEINNIKQTLAVNSKSIENFNKQDLLDRDSFEKLRQRVSKLEYSLDSNQRDIKREFIYRIQTLEEKVENVNKSMESIANNSILKFTSNMNVKKWVTLLSIAISILTSAGLLDTAITRSVDPSEAELQKKVERLLEFTN